MGEQSTASWSVRAGQLTRWVCALWLAACDPRTTAPDAMVVDPPVDLCPNVEPLVGPYAMKGSCCYRASNLLKLEQAQDGRAELEFRIMASQVVTQPRTIGSVAFLDFVQRGYDLNRSVSLIRIREFPEQPPGEVVVETGPGRFNENGTYSFLKDAAPITDISDDISRWDSVTARAYYDPEAPEGERFLPLDADLTRRLLRTPEWQADGRLDYELPQYAPRVRSMTLSDDLNCIGERGDQTRWVSHDEIESFVPVDEAARTILSSGFSLCTSMAFGFLATGTFSCDITPREFWIEKPTGICDEGVCVDGTPSPTNPDCRTDPDATNDSRPLCCDPVGASTTLPMCNAYLVRAQYVAAAVEITDEPVNDGTPLTPR